MSSTENTAGSGIADAAGERAKGMVDAGVQAANNVGCRARAVAQNANGYVRENPWLVIGVAAGVGLIAGFLLRGRRDD